MGEINVTAKIGGNTYGLDNVSGDMYKREISSPLKTSPVMIRAVDSHGNTAEQSETLEINPEWQVPKVNWTSEDLFGYLDYNRIIGNLFFLNRFMRFLFLPFEIEEMGADKNYESMIYAREFNVIEDNLQTVNQKTYQFKIGEKKTWMANKATPAYEDFNRIENACLRLYTQAMADYGALKTLSFTLGGEKGIKV